MPIRLRYLAHDLEVPPGQFVIGRTPDCQLSLDDPLVSRRHALLVVQPNGVFVEDLGARNGVFVNGARVEKIQRVRDGDVIRIGSQEMTIRGSVDTAKDGPEIRQLHRTRTMQDLQAYVDPSAGSTAAAGPPSSVPPARASSPEIAKITETAGLPKDLRVPTPIVNFVHDDIELEDATIVTASPIAAINPDRRISALSLIGGLADKALALGRAEEAERILSRTILELRDRAQRGELPAPEIAERAAGYASRLAAATGKGEWIDYVFSLYLAARALVPAKVVDEIYAAARRVKQTDRAGLRAYTAMLRELEGGFGPAERFVQQRIDGLERFIP
jgi:predicted component of type VI protein secretion system